MLNNYIHSAIKTANYEILEDSGEIYGEIPMFQGIYAKANTFETCRNELIEVLEEWIIIRLKKNLEIPVIDNINLNILEPADAIY